MNPDLKALIQLQEIDLKIQELDKQIQNVPSQIQSLQQILDDGNARLAALKEGLSEKMKGRRKAEQDTEALRAKLAKLKDQLMAVKTNKEYTAMLKEIEVCDGDIRKAEDQVLEMMEAIDQMNSEIQNTEKSVQEEAIRARALQSEMEVRIEAHRVAIEGLSAGRTSTEALIDAILLERYRKITTFRKGIGIAEARDECCMACRVRMRPQIFNEVKKNDRILTCDSCSRILYWVPPPPAAPGSEPTHSDQPAAGASGAEATP